MQERTFDLPGGTFHALIAGDGERRLLFLHGFPDHPPSAERFLASLAGRGFRVLAPWLRGYAPSPTQGPFTRARHLEDLGALVDQWSPDSPIDLVGHDWGAVFTYVLCLTTPARIRRAVTMAVPHPRTFAHQLRRPAQLRASWYMGLFQLPGAEHLVARRDFRLVDALWRRWSPGFALPAEQRAALHACLAQSMPGPIEYYRAAVREGASALRMMATPITTPLLALHGGDDGCVLRPTRDDSRLFAGDYVREIMPGVGHFMHLEDPARVATRIAEWLA